MQGFDVLLPVHGDARWLGEALHSLAAQTLAPDRVILIDDGLHDPLSADTLGERLFGRGWTRVGNRGKGISAALNTGVHHSRAPWVARMDGDDVALPTRFAAQFAWLRQSGESAVGCGTQVGLIDEAGRRVGRSQLPVGQDAIAASRLERSCFAHPTLLLRRSALLDCPYRGALDGAEDIDLVLRLGERHRLDNLDQVLLDYRIGAGQHNFRQRARQTALQELAFRLAVLRGQGLDDPIDDQPELAEAFVAWRLGQPGYVDARSALTGMRYAATFARGGSWRPMLACATAVLNSRPWRRDSLRWAWRILRASPGALRQDVLPAHLAALQGEAPGGGGA